MNGTRYEYVTYIRGTADTVFRALTDPAITARYFFGRRVESDWRPGSPWLLRMPDGQVDTEGIVVESVPAELLTLTWRVVWLKDAQLPEAVVRYRLEPTGPAVRLSLEQTTEEPVEERLMEGGRRGWPMVFAGLKTLIETGQPLELPFPTPPGS